MAFLPTDLPGCVLWLDAGAGVYSDAGTTPAVADGAVQQWNDRSGAGNHATQATTGARPLLKAGVINARPVLRFDNADDQMVTGLSIAAGGYTIYAVYSGPASGTHRAIHGSNNWLIGPYNGFHDFFAGGFVSTNAVAVTANVPVYVGAMIAGPDNPLSKFYVLGADATQTNNLSGYPGTVALGAGGQFSEPLNGDIAEVVVYTRALTAQERYNLESYLAAKYALAAPAAPAAWPTLRSSPKPATPRLRASLPGDLALDWTLSEGAGTAAADLATGQATRAGALTGSASWAAGVSGPCLQFSGGRLTSAGTFSTGGQIGIEARVRCDLLTSDYLSAAVAVKASSLGIYVHGGKWSFATGAGVWSSGTSAVVEGRWVHLFATADGANWSLWVDGMLEIRVAKTDIDSTNALYAGSDNFGGAFFGAIDYVRVWGPTLPPASEIARLAADPYAPERPPSRASAMAASLAALAIGATGAPLLTCI